MSLLEGFPQPVLDSHLGQLYLQWGNLLVLSAACRDPIMKDYVDGELLKDLFKKTIAFLRQSATATSSLRIDMNIIEGIQKEIWGIEPSYSGDTAGYPVGNAQTTSRMQLNSMDMRRQEA
ncbi:hypothetical protein IF1G_11231 [Cordyceps javanica]|uniref:Uncharacterized protein n=1 Tax=Cordyceps javanica TaxID=43265 RepID=A0A545UKV0_9HYPO|nr:hypothetical protein IF1G_11231 [Cordyceps javanica]